MATGGMLGFAIFFCFAALLLVCLGFATDHWVDVTVNREEVTFLFPGTATTDENLFTRYRGIFKVCYEGSDTLFLDGNPDLVSGNCLWIEGLTMESNEDTIGFEDEYDWRNHLIRAQMASTIIGMLALLAGVILASIGCWKLSPRGFRLAGLIVFIGAFFVACAMGCFHGYDYLEREKINQPLQGLFPRYWQDNASIDQASKMNYGWSYIISWVGMGLAAISAILLLCTAYNVQWDDDYNKYAEKKLQKKVKRNRFFGRSQPPPPPYVAATPVYGTPAPSLMGPAPPVYGPPVYGQVSSGPAPVVEVPVEVPVAVPVEPPQIIPVLDKSDGYGYDDGYGYNDGYTGGYGGGYGGDFVGYGGYVDDRPIFGPAPYGEPDRYWI